MKKAKRDKIQKIMVYIVLIMFVASLLPLVIGR
ncbi:membrane protein insertase Oxa1/YidC/SpoIIIJ [Clostridium pascui]|nr:MULTISPECIES: DUF4044 domain-containing protein [Clostridium]MBE6068248.1 DUF4044 domain-containing protein [Clostridium lundense]MBM7868953.1 membrane protein insertase Oxa1/YidC/SpoIIIJ [Clostridium pascui]